MTEAQLFSIGFALAGRFGVRVCLTGFGKAAWLAKILSGRLRRDPSLS